MKVVTKDMLQDDGPRLPIMVDCRVNLEGAGPAAWVALRIKHANAETSVSLSPYQALKMAEALLAAARRVW